MSDPRYDYHNSEHVEEAREAYHDAAAEARMLADEAAAQGNSDLAEQYSNQAEAMDAAAETEG